MTVTKVHNINYPTLSAVTITHTHPMSPEAGSQFLKIRKVTNAIHILICLVPRLHMQSSARFL